MPNAHIVTRNTIWTDVYNKHLQRSATDVSTASFACCRTLCGNVIVCAPPFLQFGDATSIRICFLGAVRFRFLSSALFSPNCIGDADCASCDTRYHLDVLCCLHNSIEFAHAQQCLSHGIRLHALSKSERLLLMLFLLLNMAVLFPYMAGCLIPPDSMYARGSNLPRFACLNLVVGDPWGMDCG